MLLTSGYSHVLAQNGTYGFELLHKPYFIKQLSRLLQKAPRGSDASGSSARDRAIFAPWGIPADDLVPIWSSRDRPTMDLYDIVFSALTAATVASLAWLGLLQAHKDKDEENADGSIDSAAVDMVALTAVVTFVAMMVARHPEWTS